MDDSKTIGRGFDAMNLFLKDLFGSSFINLGYWGKRETTIAKAQAKLVDLFGKFSKLDHQSIVLDVGFGNGAPDYFFMDQYHCKHLMGIDIASQQVKKASEDLDKKPRYKKRMVFEIGDALDLQKFPKQSFNRVLSLESAQLFPDKKKFLRGVKHVLQTNGFLCLAQFMPSQGERLDFDPLITFSNQIIFPKNLKNDQIELIKTVMIDLLMKEKEIVEKNPFYKLSLPNYFELIQEFNFKIVEKKELTSAILPFFSKVKEKIFKNIKAHKYNEVILPIVNNVLAYFLIQERMFKEKISGYYFIRAKKT